MTAPEFFVTPGNGDRNRELFHYSQAVKIGDRIELAGQGGWNDDWQFPEKLSDEIDQAFLDIDRTLATAGASWDHVVIVRSYHIDIDSTTVETMSPTVPWLSTRSPSSSRDAPTAVPPA